MKINIQKIQNNELLLAQVKLLADAYRQELKAHDKVASGDLVNFNWDVTVDGNSFNVYFNLPDYWKYVEHGRRPGRFPPIRAIENWIMVKPIVPHPYNGKIPTTKQLAFLIARSIARNGIKPTNSLEDAVDKSEKIFQKIKKIIFDEISEQLYDEINKQVSTWNE